MPGTREPELSRVFVELADTMVSDFDVIDFLHMLVGRCVDLLDVDAAGLMLADHAGALRVMASSSEQARLLELFEIQNEEGPCLDSFRMSEVVMERDLTGTDRWPKFRVEALRAGFTSVAAVPMRLRKETIGALNLFRAAPGVLDDDEATTSRALADIATIGLLQERAVREARTTAEQLQSALDSRVVIEQAKGILAERGNVEMDAAFDRLRRHARRHNTRLALVARDVISGAISMEELAV